MKVEIEVELPEHIAKDWEVVRIGILVDGDGVFIVNSDGVMVDRWRGPFYGPMPRIILGRKITPRDWWPKIIIADKMTLEKAGSIRLENHSGSLSFFSDQSEMIDFSWIPKHLRRSGTTIKNPWKGTQQ